MSACRRGWREICGPVAARPGGASPAGGGRRGRAGGGGWVVWVRRERRERRRAYRRVQHPPLGRLDRRLDRALTLVLEPHLHLARRHLQVAGEGAPRLDARELVLLEHLLEQLQRVRRYVPPCRLSFCFARRAAAGRLLAQLGPGVAAVVERVGSEQRRVRRVVRVRLGGRGRRGATVHPEKLWQDSQRPFVDCGKARRRTIVLLFCTGRGGGGGARVGCARSAPEARRAPRKGSVTASPPPRARSPQSPVRHQSREAVGVRRAGGRGERKRRAWRRPRMTSPTFATNSTPTCAALREPAARAGRQRSSGDLERCEVSLKSADRPN